MSRRVTLADVSKATGFGIATVSRALAPQDHPDVSAETRVRIRHEADRLGYRPSMTARALRNHDYRAVSIMLPQGIWSAWEAAMRGAYEAAEALGYRTLVQPVANIQPLGDPDLRTLPYAGPSTAASIVASLVEVPTEGLLIFGSADDAGVVEAARRLRLPLVSIDDVAETFLMPTFVADSRLGARMAVEHLTALGRRKIAYIGSDYTAFYANARQLGYRDALAGAGIAFDPELMVMCSDTINESIRFYPEFESFLAAKPEIDAIFCEADQIAAPVLRSLRKWGIDVPSDVSVVGFDDERAAAIVDPPLTTIRQPYEELGRRAIEALIQAINGSPIPASRQMIAPSLVVRGSSAR